MGAQDTTRHEGRGRAVATAGLAAALVAAALVGCDGNIAPGQEDAPSREATVEVFDRMLEEDAGQGTEETVQEPEAPTFDPSGPDVGASTGVGVTVLAPEGFSVTQAMADVDTQVQALLDRGHDVGVVLTDLGSGRRISYNADKPFYPASSVKALYCAMVCEKHGGSGGMAAQMRQCLVDSSNEDYEALISAYGMSSFGSWLAAHGAPEAAPDGSYHFYPEISAAEMAACWQEIWRYGTSGEPGAAELTGYLERTAHSPTGELLRDTCEVWSKPGWFPATSDGLSATVDAGVVFAPSCTYVLVVMSDMPSDLDGLKPLIAALDAAHATMMTGVDALPQ